MCYQLYLTQTTVGQCERWKSKLTEGKRWAERGEDSTCLQTPIIRRKFAEISCWTSSQLGESSVFGGRPSKEIVRSWRGKLAVDRTHPNCRGKLQRDRHSPERKPSLDRLVQVWSQTNFFFPFRFCRFIFLPSRQTHYRGFLNPSQFEGPSATPCKLLLEVPFGWTG